MNAETWLPVVGFEGLYKVSSLGRVASLRKGIGTHQPTERGMFILRLSQTSYGYLQVNLSRNGKQNHFKAHVLVARAFIPNSVNKPQVNHKDFNKENNAVENLEWVTGTENMHHFNASQRGLYKMSDNDVLDIRTLAAFGATGVALSGVFECSARCISQIISRKTYSHI